MPSIGKAIASKVEEYLKTGEIQYYNQLKSNFPLNLDEFSGLEGIGPKTLKLIYDKLQVKNLDDLQKAASEGKIRAIDGFSQKKEEAILKKINLYIENKNRFLLGEVYPLVRKLKNICQNWMG